MSEYCIRTSAQIAVTLLAASCCIAGARRSVWDGVYTKEQSSRGQAVYREECAKCHSENLAGGEAPALAGSVFLKNWNGKSVGDLLERIGTTMPEDDPGNLSRRQYADLAAYILRANEFPAGQQDLDITAGAIKDIAIEERK